MAIAPGPSCVVSLWDQTRRIFYHHRPQRGRQTTLLRLLAGIDKPASGTIEILGKPVGDYRRKTLARRMALVPQLSQVDFRSRCARWCKWVGRRFGASRSSIGARPAYRSASHAIYGHRSPDRTAFVPIERWGVSAGFLARAICQAPDISSWTNLPRLWTWPIRSA